MTREKTAAEEDDIEAWVKRLAGDDEKDAAADAATLDALRAVIRRDDDAARNAAASNQIARARLLKRLEDEGMFEPQRDAHRQPWRPWVAMAASVLVVVLGTWHYLQPAPAPVYRGISGNIVIVDTRPAQKAADIIRQLQALGVQVDRVEDGQRVTLQANVAADRLDAFFQWAAANDARAVAPGLYHIHIDAPAQE